MYCQVHSWTRSKWKSTHLIFGYCLMSGRFSFLMMFAPFACCRKVCFYCQPLTSRYENSMNVIDSIYIVLVVKCHWLYLHCACSWILLLSKNGLSAWDVRHEFFLPVNFPFLLKLMVNLSYHFCFFVYFHCAWGVRHADVLIMNYAYFYSSLFTLCLRPFPIYLGLYLHDFALLIIEWFGRCSSEIMIR